jgi:hypothetical protein
LEFSIDFETLKEGAKLEDWCAVPLDMDDFGNLRYLFGFIRFEVWELRFVGGKRDEVKDRNENCDLVWKSNWLLTMWKLSREGSQIRVCSTQLSFCCEGWSWDQRCWGEQRRGEEMKWNERKGEKRIENVFEREQSVVPQKVIFVRIPKFGGFCREGRKWRFSTMILRVSSQTRFSGIMGKTVQNITGKVNLQKNALRRGFWSRPMNENATIQAELNLHYYFSNS